MTTIDKMTEYLIDTIPGIGQVAALALATQLYHLAHDE